MATRIAPETDTATSNEWPWVRLTATAGIACVALVVAGILIAGEGLDADDGPDQVRAYFVEHRAQALTAAYLESLGLACLLAFAAGLSGLARRAGADPWGVFGQLMVGGAAATLAVMLVANMARAALASRGAAAEPAMVRTLWDLYTESVLAFVPATVFLVGAAGGILRGSLLPRWLGWAALAPALLALLGAATLGDPRGPVSFLGFVGGDGLLLLWMLVTSILLFKRAVSRRPGAIDEDATA